MRLFTNTRTGAWFEIESERGANLSGLLSRSDLSGSYRAFGDEYGARYFVLIAEDGLAHVWVATKGSGSKSPLVGGFFHNDPFVDHADDLGALSEMLDLPVGRESLMLGAQLYRHEGYLLSGEAASPVYWMDRLTQAEERFFRAALREWFGRGVKWELDDLTIAKRMEEAMTEERRSFIEAGLAVPGIVADAVREGMAKVLRGKLKASKDGEDQERVQLLAAALARLEGRHLLREFSGWTPDEAPIARF